MRQSLHTKRKEWGGRASPIFFMSNQNFNFDDAFNFGTEIENNAENTAGSAAEPVTVPEAQGGSSFDFDELFDSFKEAEVDTVASATVVPTNVSTSKKEKTLRLEGVKAIVMGGGKKVTVKEGMFAKKSATISEVVSVYLENAKIEAPAEAYTAASNGAEIRIAYNVNNVLSDTDTLPANIITYRFVSPEGSLDFLGDVTAKIIRDALTGVLAKYADPLYRFVVCSENRIVPIPVVEPFVLPFTEKLTVSVNDKDVTLSFEPAKKEPGKTEPKEGDEDEEGSEEPAETGTEELSSEVIAAALRKEVKDAYLDVAKTADGTLLVLPRLTSGLTSVAAAKAEAKKPVDEMAIKRPLTPNLKIYWGWGSIELATHPKCAGKKAISGKEALEILKAEQPVVFGKITKMTWYEKEECWYPGYPSSTKGAETPLFRVSGTNVMRLVPRVPLDLVTAAFERFKEEEKNTGNESAAAMLFDTRTKTWRLSFPTQAATPIRVTCNFWEEAELPYEFVGVQMHCHPNMTISFSSTDDEDEVYDGVLYGVLRRSDAGDGLYAFDVRIRQGDNFLYVPANLFFEMPERI